MKTRLNVYMAECGVAARRKAEELILGGRVRVNGRIVLAPYFTVTEGDLVECDGKRLALSPKIYLAMNKPAGVVCAVSDKHDAVVVDILPAHMRTARVFPVGRLDRESEGLLILTNDGKFAQSVQHPSKGVTKEYEVLLNVGINEKQLARWRKGFEIGGKTAVPLSVEPVPREPQNQWIRISIGEGLKREIHEMARATGFKVEMLIRRRIGFLTLEKLERGQFVELSFHDLYTKIFEGGSV